MMDGSLKEDGKTPAPTTTTSTSTRKVVEMAHAVGVSVEGELGCLGSLETMHGEQGRRPRRRRHADPRAAADRPGAGRRFRRRRPARCAGHRDRHLHGAYKFTPQADRRHPGDRPRSRKSTRAFPNTHLVMHGSLERAAGIAGDHPRVRRRDEGNLRRAGRGNPARASSTACARSTSTPTSAWR